MTYKRLDRCLCNVQWQLLFPETIVKNGVRVCSNHHPLIIDTSPQYSPEREPPFRFEAAWLNHASFESFLADNWRKGEEAHKNLRELQKPLKVWKKEVFGHIRFRIRGLNRRLEGIQKSVTRDTNPFLRTLERRLHNELIDALKQEEILWYQKSRGTSITQGDRNTKYYYSKTLARRRKNKIKCLKNNEGD